MYNVNFFYTFIDIMLYVGRDCDLYRPSSIQSFLVGKQIRTALVRQENSACFFEREKTFVIKTVACLGK